MEKEYHKGQELTMPELGLSLEELAGQPLELFAREGAKLLLTVAMEEEVADFLGCRRYERNQGSRRGYRNGHRERQVNCGAGEIEVAMPRISDTKEVFRSQLLEAWSFPGRTAAGFWKRRSLYSTLKGYRLETLNEHSVRCGARAVFPAPVLQLKDGQINPLRKSSTTGVIETYLWRR